MILKHLTLGMALLAATVSAVSAQYSTPAHSVSSFYKYDRTNSQIFDRRNLDARKKWLSPRLYQLFREELQRSALHLKDHPDDKPYFGDGFPFAPLSERCDTAGKQISQRYRLGKAVFSRRERAHVLVTFFYPRPCTIDTSVYKLNLIKSKSGWVIDDVIFEDGNALSEQIKQHRY